MLDVIRDSTFGQIVNFASGGKLLPYADQRADYVVPAKYLLHPQAGTSGTSSQPLSSANTIVGDDEPFPKTKTTDSQKTMPVDAPHKVEVDLEKGHETPAEVEEEKKIERYQYLVEWDSDQDPENPRNWSKRKRYAMAFLICLLTFSVYIGSAIFTASIPGIMEEFHVSGTVAILGMSLFVLGYGLGPMVLSPLSEIPKIGRNPPYIISLALFVLFQMPIVLAKNLETVLIFRFLSGVVGSPALATGGASMGDLFPPDSIPYAIAAWSIGAIMGPTMGPVIGGFAAQANGWKWPMFELLWLSGFTLITLFFFLPETLESTVLLRRAQRLRKLTGNHLLRTAAELERENEPNIVHEIYDQCVLAVRLSAEPAVLFGNVYIALVYSIFYLFFVSYDLVFQGIYGFSLGIGGLPYLGFIVAAFFAYIFYHCYNRFHLEPRYQAADGNLPPEVRLELAFGAAFLVPISIFWFGWTARADVHWIVPLIGASLYLPGVFYIFQCILLYIVMGYPKFSASILAGNDLFRSTSAAAFPIFGSYFFKGLGIGGGSSLLAGLSILMIIPLWLIQKYGARLRARSKWTTYSQ